jgi:hypothetical protein
MKKISQFIIICLCVLAFISCGTFQMRPYDESVPLEEQANLIFPSEISIWEFDGNKVQWIVPFQSAKAQIAVPAGKHYIICNYYFNNGKYSQSANNIMLNIDVEPGENYEIKYRFQNGFIYLNLEKIQ